MEIPVFRVRIPATVAYWKRASRAFVMLSSSSSRIYAPGVRRRDLATRTLPKRSNASRIIIAVFVVFVLLIVWLALQTLGGHSTKHDGAAISRTL
jgi:hypothetical protein